MKLLILADLHLGASKGLSPHPKILRQANTETESAFTRLVPKFNNQNFDLVVQMGDLVSEMHDKNIDAVNYRKALNALSNLETKTVKNS
ncbi:metallophosphoesterase [Candidatus Woesebacteria bacterium]|nr:metallophosphoesterase [Candidatus Woesebacteria bacterium]